MEYVRTTVDSTRLYGIIDVPPKLRVKMVEVIILPLENNISETQKTKSESAFGRLKKYADPTLASLEEGAWERAMVERYANR